MNTKQMFKVVPVPDEAIVAAVNKMIKDDLGTVKRYFEKHVVCRGNMFMAIPRPGVSAQELIPVFKSLVGMVSSPASRHTEHNVPRGREAAVESDSLVFA